MDDTAEANPICCICFDECVDPLELPCGHIHCRACIEELRQKGVDKSHGRESRCPLCRKPLPPGPDEKAKAACRFYDELEKRVNSDPSMTWDTLGPEDQRLLDDHRVALMELRHPQATGLVAEMYMFGRDKFEHDGTIIRVS